ncbi:hypothetical protein BDP27DRAFT_1429947 [Rhodocollybia butyracea]|uniref:Uncharacterized protein n=1 Tax=Rhodocollybia butyracea TaxID=206335 RepID=A0A9P5PD58_9AGAR|nr:hypothetical protein BDP27DRAFT_1429947 [Rhodocollybia butyracea]
MSVELRAVPPPPLTHAQLVSGCSLISVNTTAEWVPSTLAFLPPRTASSFDFVESLGGRLEFLVLDSVSHNRYSVFFNIKLSFLGHGAATIEHDLTPLLGRAPGQRNLRFEGLKNLVESGSTATGRSEHIEVRFTLNPLPFLALTPPTLLFQWHAPLAAAFASRNRKAA